MHGKMQKLMPVYFCFDLTAYLLRHLNPRIKLLPRVDFPYLVRNYHTEKNLWRQKKTGEKKDHIFSLL